ncbi:MAG: pentapeptide repeat-containing protein [Chitinophagaceae bacterium]
MYKIPESFKKKLQNQSLTITFLVIILLMIMLVIIAQIIAEKGAIPGNPKDYGNAKIEAEIKQIRSDTSGSLFWLKLIGIFVTVGGAVGGYLIGQSRATQKKLNFEHRKDVDIAYQAIVQELSSKEAILRATAAVKLGSILQNFPAEWNVTLERENQLVKLTKQVLAAALSIEADEKVLKTITIALVLHKSLQNEIKGKKVNFADVRELDLSGAKAKNAYWAKSDFSFADFFSADLEKTSFRNSILKSAQFLNANLVDAVFIDAICENANFKGAKMYGMKLTGAEIKGVDTTVLVDNSKEGDGSKMITLQEWLHENIARDLEGN